MTNLLESDVSDNHKEIEHWTGAAGQKWGDQADALDAMLQPYSNKLLDALAVKNGERIIDIGCDSGALTFQAEKAVGGQSAAIGVDVSAPLIELAKHRALRSNSRALFKLAHAWRQPFDRATCAPLGSSFER